MKIERLNENQIRCTLTRADLAERHLKLSELAYGSEKAKALFHDMMQQASHNLGFHAEDIPIMIEAIPASSDSLVLIITKVEDPEELDTRFSRFTPFAEAGGAPPLEEKGGLEGAEDFRQQMEASQPTSGNAAGAPTAKARLFSFSSMDSLIRAARVLGPLYQGEDTLYKDPADERLILAMLQSGHTTSEFNKICNMLSEYATPAKATGVSLAHLEEHCTLLIPTDALQRLAGL